MTRTTRAIPDAVTPDSEATPARSRRRGAWLLLLLALIAGGLAAWQFWPRLAPWFASHQDAGPTPLDERLAAIERELDDQRAALRQLDRRIGDSLATHRVIRDEVLGVGERLGLLEESVGRLADPHAHADEALRLDEVELLLSMGRQRLELGGDLVGALRAYALAEQMLAGLDDPAYVNLRQTLAQERNALDALGKDPRDVAIGELLALEAKLDGLPTRAPARGRETASAAARLFSRLVETRPSGELALATPSDRDLGLNALRLELALARGALERRDEAAFQAALEHILAWLPRLYAASAALDERMQRLRALRGRGIALDLPVLGSTLDQLRQLRGRDGGEA